MRHSVRTAEFFDDEQCDFLIGEAEKLREQFIPGRMTIAGRAAVYTQVRNNFTFYINEGDPLWPAVEQIHRKIAEVNQVIYHFDLDKALRGDFVRYEGEANSFGWHPDDDFMHERTPFRKLTGAIQLSRPEDYDGGVLELRDEFGVDAIPRARGFLTVFPSFITHRVTPVTRGTRYSLVACAAGPRWR